MRKISTFLFALIMMITAANAQTVENKGVFSQMYIGLSTGSNYNPVLNQNNFNTLTYNIAFELGKDITPITGFSLQGITNTDFTNGFDLYRIDVFGNTKFNLMNLFGGYKGYPRRFEIKTVTGIGWNHKINRTDNPNDIALQAGLEFDFNLGKNRNWYITFTPMIQTNEILRSYDIIPMIQNADLKANIGIAYRFGQGNSHNFILCPYTYTENEYDELNNEYNKVNALYNECINKPAEIDTIVIKEKVEVEVVKLVSDGKEFNFVPFVKGSAEIKGLGREMLDYIIHNLSKDIQLEVIGSADTSTGTLEFNQQLALKRAENVANELKDNGFDNIIITTVLDKFESIEMSRCAVIIRK